MFPTQPYQKLKNAAAFMNRKREKVKREFFVNFDLFFGVSVVFLSNFTDILAANDTTTYCKIILIDISVKKLFPNDL